MSHHSEEKRLVIIEMDERGYNFELPDGHQVGLDKNTGRLTLTDQQGRMGIFELRGEPVLTVAEERYAIGKPTGPTEVTAAGRPEYSVVLAVDERKRLRERWEANGRSATDYMKLKRTTRSAAEEFNAVRRILRGDIPASS